MFQRGRLSRNTVSRAPLCDLGRDQCWLVLCMQEFTSLARDSVTATADGHQVFATPPCPAQRSLAIVDAADVAACIVSGSFSLRGEGGDAVRSISAGRGRSVESSALVRTAGAWRKCVHRSWRRRALDPPPGCRDIGTAAVMTHRPEKRVSHLGQPPTPSGMMMTVLAACSSRHEPDQIDFVFYRRMLVSATVSDRWGLTATTPSTRQKKTWRASVRKPIAWRCHDRGQCKDGLRARLKIQMAPDESGVSPWKMPSRI